MLLLPQSAHFAACRRSSQCPGPAAGVAKRSSSTKSLLQTLKGELNLLATLQTLKGELPATLQTLNLPAKPATTSFLNVKRALAARRRAPPEAKPLVGSVAAKPSSGRDAVWGCIGVGSAASSSSKAMGGDEKVEERRLKKSFPLDPKQPDLGSWLFSKSGAGGKTFGCKACHLAGADGPYGQVAATLDGGRARGADFRLKSHANSLVHLKAVAQLTGSLDARKVAANVHNERAAPPNKWFSRLWDNYKVGNRGHVVNADMPLGAMGKQRRGVYCLAEAIRMIDRDHIEKSASLASHTDGRGSRLTMRFSATTEANLECRRGTIGQIDSAKLKARSTADAAIIMVNCYDKILREFCTFGHGAPARPSGNGATKQHFDEELFEHLKSIHEIFDTDADPVMLLSGMEMTQSFQDGVLPYFKNNVVQIRDKTHGARRVLQKPWKAHAAIQDIVATIISRRSSIMKRIRNSSFCAEVFHDALQAQGDNPAADSKAKIYSAASASHRFDSVMRDLVRHDLFLDAYCVAAYRISVARHGKDEGNDACDYLEYVSGDEGLLRLTLMGMLADGGDEIFRFLRTWDTESSDPAMTSRVVAAMVKKLDHLFVEGHCRSMGFTAHVVAALKKTRTFVVRGKPLTIGCSGGVPERVFKKALAVVGVAAVVVVVAVVVAVVVVRTYVVVVVVVIPQQ